MSAASRSAELLDRIAATLGVPATAFTAPDPQPASDPAPAAHIAALVFDPDGRRFAAAFARLTPHARCALANSAEALCHGFAAGEPSSTAGRR